MKSWGSKDEQVDGAGSESVGEVSYLDLIRGNRDFRFLWAGDVVSLFGDWFNTIALYTLVESLTGSPLALGIVFMLKTLASAVASPLAGVLVDRVDRRRMMILTDLLRALVVLFFLFIDSPEEVPLLYVLLVLQIAIGSGFKPARSASLPNITSPRELLTANAVMATTWSTLLALGAALGGLATSALGVEAVFIIDSASYLVSAACVWAAKIPQPSLPVSKEPLHRAAWREMVLGWRYIIDNAGVGRMAIAKAFWLMSGGGLVYMLVMLGKSLTPHDAAMGMGILLAARGIGSGVGPIAARAIFKRRRGWPLVMGFCISLSGVGYVLVAAMEWSFWIVLPVLGAHAMSAAHWVLSSVLLQERSADHVRGRVFATEWLLLTLFDAASVAAASLLLEYGLLDIGSAIVVFAVVQIVTGLVWIALIVPAEREAHAR